MSREREMLATMRAYRQRPRSINIENAYRIFNAQEENYFHERMSAALFEMIKDGTATHGSNTTLTYYQRACKQHMDNAMERTLTAAEQEYIALLKYRSTHGCDPKPPTTGDEVITF